MKSALGKKLLIGIGILLIAGLFVGLNIYRNQKENGGKDVKTAAAARGQLSFNVLANGLVEPGVKAEIRSRVTGTVDSIQVAEGDQVKKGQKLATFSQNDFRSRAVRAESAAAQARAQEGQLRTKARYWQDQVNLQIAQAESRLRQAAAALDKQESAAKVQIAEAQSGLESTRSSVDQSKVTQADLDAAKDRVWLATQREKDYRWTTEREKTQIKVDVQAAQAEYDRLKAKYDHQVEQTKRQLDAAQARLDSAEAELKKLQDEASSSARAQVKEAQAALDLARVNAELSRVSPDDIASAEAATRSAQVEYQRALDDLDASLVTSPIDGKVIWAPVKSGEGAAPGVQLFTIGQIDQVLVKAKVDEVDIGKVSLGQPVEISSSAYLGKTFRGKVNKIAPRAIKDGNINIFEVEVLAENPDQALRPGMNVDVTITADQKKEALLVPSEAIIERDGKKFVFVEDSSVARQRQIKTGSSNRTSVEIVDGLKDGDRVIAGPADILKTIKEGDRVKGAESGNGKKEGSKP